MIRAIGFNIGLRGDLAMSTVAARSFKEVYPDSHLTLGVGPQFRDLLPLFHDSQFDSTHVYTTYDGWPGPKDKEYLRAAKYDLVFDGMAPHPDNRWYEYRHQYSEAVHMHGLPIPQNIKPKLCRWFSLDHSFSRTVAISPFGGNGVANNKMLLVDQAQKIVHYLLCCGYSVLHIGAATEPELIGADRLDTCYFDSIRNMLSCRALIHCDTGAGHFAGAYDHPSLGLYGYPEISKVQNIKPLHSNFLSVDAPTIPELNMDEVFAAIDKLLS